MERIIRTQDYLGSVLKNNLTGKQSAANSLGLSIAQLTGNYCHADFESALIGFGPHADGYIHVSLDEDLVCHNQACAGWMEKLAKQFNISTSQISVVRTGRPRSLLTNETGVAVGHESIIAKKSFGTLGGFIYPRFEGDAYRIVSNNHVLAATNRGAKGDAVCSVTNATYKIAELENSVELFGNGITNYLDLAVARLVDGYQPTQRPVLAPTKKGMKHEGVTKFGAKTGFTRGKIVSDNYRIAINYDGENALFENQLMIMSTVPGQKFSDGGDSGSMVKSVDGGFVGLLFAGNNSQTFANPSQRVINKLIEWGYM